MLSINMRIFKTVLLLAVVYLFRAVQCLPIADETSITDPSSSTLTPPPTPPLYSSASDDLYDQRQNGTENYRIHVDGLVFVVAPAEALLAAAAENKPNLPVTSPPKPPSTTPENDPKPSPAPKSVQRAGLRLANFLIPLLRRIHQA
ncbi:uncharacterized protein LOC108631024 [Ceratina calcarata]|uniref:Uncharacterized protein LOC108631024 n=1 Tax=Ceratina calcarata TaxID=156304 RepID=A0AAJ7JDG6_9HYME|nr:uncharacterized protein LOC108631024 [Ceratina calcarata]